MRPLVLFLTASLCHAASGATVPRYGFPSENVLPDAFAVTRLEVDTVKDKLFYR